MSKLLSVVSALGLLAATAQAAPECVVTLKHSTQSQLNTAIVIDFPQSRAVNHPIYREVRIISQDDTSLAAAEGLRLDNIRQQHVAINGVEIQADVTIDGKLIGRCVVQRDDQRR